MANRLTELTGDERFRNYWMLALAKEVEILICEDGKEIELSALRMELEKRKKKE